jgi:hypothetical protein
MQKKRNDLLLAFVYTSVIEDHDGGGADLAASPALTVIGAARLLAVSIPLPNCPENH